MKLNIIYKLHKKELAHNNYLLNYSYCYFATVVIIVSSGKSIMYGSQRDPHHSNMTMSSPFEWTSGDLVLLCHTRNLLILLLSQLIPSLAPSCSIFQIEYFLLQWSKNLK